MNELTQEQRARIFAMYLGTMCNDHYGNPHVLTTYNIATLTVWGKLLLRPLSALADEDAAVVADILFPTNTLSAIPGKKVYVGLMSVLFHLCDISWDNDNQFDTGSSRKIISELRPYNLTIVFQYLIQRGYSLPLFIAPNHPLNGQDAISMGLAVDLTDVNQPACNK